MHQDPTRVASLLSSLKAITDEQATYLIVTNGIPRAAVFGIDAAGAVTFHACADSFTRALAEAHDNGRKILGRKEMAHEVPVTAKPDESSSMSSDIQKTETAGGENLDNRPAVSIFANVAALRGLLGDSISPMVGDLLSEIQTAAVYNDVKTLPEGTPVEMPQLMAVAGILPEIEAKISDAVRELDSSGPALAAKSFLESALEQLKILEDKVFS